MVGRTVAWDNLRGHVEKFIETSSSGATSMKHTALAHDPPLYIIAAHCAWRRTPYDLPLRRLSAYRSWLQLIEPG